MAKTAARTFQDAQGCVLQEVETGALE